MEMAQKLCLLEMTRKFISMIVRFRHQPPRLMLQTERIG